MTDDFRDDRFEGAGRNNDSLAAAERRFRLRPRFIGGSLLCLYGALGIVTCLVLAIHYARFIHEQGWDAADPDMYATPVPELWPTPLRLFLTFIALVASVLSMIAGVLCFKGRARWALAMVGAFLALGGVAALLGHRASTPSAAQLACQRGQNHHNGHEYDKAIQAFTEAIRLNPDYFLAHLDRGLVHARLGNHHEAIADLTRAVDLKPRYAFAYYARGSSYWALGQEQQAMADLAKARALDPSLRDPFREQPN